MKYTPTELTSTYAAIAALNDNFASIQDLLEKCLFRDGTAPNEMLTSLDLNGFRINNVADPVNETDVVNKRTVESLIAALTGVVNALNSSALSYTPAGTGAVVRSVESKLRDNVNVRDFGAVGDGVADDTAAIQAAVNAVATLGGLVWFPSGTYKITAAINITTQGVHLVGYARNSTVISQTTLTSKIFNVTGNFNTINGFRLTYTGGTPLAGATAIFCSGGYCHFHDFTVANGYVDLEFTTGVAIKVHDFEALNYESIGVYIHGLNDIYINNFILNCGNTTRGALGGFRLIDKVEAAVISFGDVIMGAFSMVCDAAANTQGVRPAYNKFNSVYFDSATNGVTLNNTVETDFNNCWFSNRPNNGCSLNNTDGVRFTGGGAINCGTNGVFVGTGAVRTVFNGFRASGNSTTTANTYNGIAIGANVTDFIVKGCTLGGSLGFGSQQYGVNVNVGSSDRYIIADNLVSGNSTGGVVDNGTGTNKRVANNY